MMRIVQLMLVVLVISLQPEAVYSKPWYNVVGDWFSGPFSNWWAHTLPNAMVTGWNATAEAFTDGWTATSNFFTGHTDRKKQLKAELAACNSVNENVRETVDGESNPNYPLLVPDSEIPLRTLNQAGKPLLKRTKNDVQSVDDNYDASKAPFNISQACQYFGGDNGLGERLKKTFDDSEGEKQDKKKQDWNNLPKQTRQQRTQANIFWYLQCDDLVGDTGATFKVEYPTPTAEKPDATSTFDSEKFCNFLIEVDKCLLNIDDTNCKANVDTGTADTSSRAGLRDYDDSYDSSDNASSEN